MKYVVNRFCIAKVFKKIKILEYISCGKYKLINKIKVVENNADKIIQIIEEISKFEVLFLIKPIFELLLRWI